MPSLREHREDVPDIANLMLSRLVEAREVPPRQFSTAALNALRNYDWPGNLAQLESVVRTLALTCGGEQISLEDVEPRAAAARRAASRSAHDLPLDLPLREARDAFERVYFEYHIAREGGNISRVAETRRARAHAPLPQAEAARHQARPQERRRGEHTVGRKRSPSGTPFGGRRCQL